ncbi:MAG: hypothetical protein WCJ59_03700 [bacterium]
MTNGIILLVDDSKSILELAENLVRRHCSKSKILLAPTIEVATWTFEKYKKQLRIVLLDGSLDNNHNCDTLPLAIAIKAAKDRHEFLGEAIAISANSEHNDKLIMAGCIDALHFLNVRSCSTIKLEVIKKVAKELSH